MNFVVMGPVSQDPRLTPLPPGELAEILGDAVYGGAGKLIAVGTRVCKVLSLLQIKAADLITNRPLVSKGDIIFALQVSSGDDGSDTAEWEAYKCSPGNAPAIH